MSNLKLISFIAVASNYDLFHIVVDDGYEFGSTQIVERNDGSLEFKRLFATSVYSDNALIDVQALSETEFVCKTPDKAYHIFALHKKPQQIPNHPQRKWNDITDLMDVSYFGERFTTYIKELDTLFLVVDPYLLGELAAVEQFQIKNIINVYLGGLSRSMQMCRTVCFQVRMNRDCKKIFAGMYDLERGCSVTSNLIFDERNSDEMSEEFLKKVDAILLYAEKTFEKIVKKPQNNA